MREDDRPGGAIVTDRLVLRPMLAADAPALHALLDGHPDVWRHEPGRPLPYEERLAWVETHAREPLTAAGQSGLFGRAVALRDGGEVLGCAGLLPVIVPGGLTPAEAGEGRLEVELFFQLGQAHWGRGYMTEATEALCRLALVVLRLPRLFAATQAGNRRAVALLRRLRGAVLALDRPPGSFWGREPVCAIVSGGRAADAGRG